MIRTLIPVLLLATAWHLPGSHAEDPRAFVTNLYVLEAKGQLSDFSVFLIPSLSSLVAKDRERYEGEGSKLDFDPICDCQDPDDLQFKITQITTTGGSAYATVLLTFADSSTRTVHLDLLKTSGKWAISDIRIKEFLSLQKFLVKG